MHVEVASRSRPGALAPAGQEAAGDARGVRRAQPADIPGMAGAAPGASGRFEMDGEDILQLSTGPCLKPRPARCFSCGFSLIACPCLPCGLLTCSITAFSHGLPLSPFLNWRTVQVIGLVSCIQHTECLLRAAAGLCAVGVRRPALVDVWPRTQ